MLSINTNLSSLIVQNSLKQSTNRLNTAIERLTTGFKINHAKDNAANYNIATNMTTKLGALQVAEDNCTMGLDLLTTASDALSQISSHLTRLRDLGVQASNATYGEESLTAINKEATSIVEEINRLYSTTKYNGISLFDSAQGAGCDMESLPEVGASGFIKEIQRRDTSSMTTLASVDETVALTSGTFSISTPEELVKLATMTRNQLIGENVEFVLSNDIDLSGITNWEPIGGYGTVHNKTFNATFDGNGYKIKNLSHNTIISGYTYIGFFGYTKNATIKNLGLENINITATRSYSGGLVGFDHASTTIENCYSTGELNVKVSGGGLLGNLSQTSSIRDSYSNVKVTVETGTGTQTHFGGLVGTNRGRIINCFATGDIIGTENATNLGGLTGISSGLISNCYAAGNITGYNSVGGLVAWLPGDEDSKIGLIENCFSSGDVTLIGKKSTYTLGRAGGLFASSSESTAKNCSTKSKVTTTMSDNYVLSSIGNNAKNATEYYPNVEIINCTYDSLVNPDLNPTEGDIKSSNIFDLSKINSIVDINLQIGVNSKDASEIKLICSFNLSGLYSLCLIGLNNTNYISQVDLLLETVSAKQVEYGAIENRLNSALDEISTQYENLVSSRSTLQDADIADISSEYIRQQILQQASATLLATANQSASIALSLI